MSDDSKSEINLDVGFLKRINWKAVLIVLFLLFGIYIRLFHVDFPSIGYHNMKENEYLDQAVFFSEVGDYTHKQAFAFYGFDETTGYHEEYGQAPLVPYMILAIWKIFGESIILPRLLMIAFFMSAIFMGYLIVRRLTKNNFVSVLSLGLMSIMPLGIFFGRNIQPEPPALFFSLLAIWFYLTWVKDLSKTKYILYATLALSIAGLFKYTFLIFAVPIMFIFPYKEFYQKFIHHRKAAIKDLLYGVYGLIPFFLGVWFFEVLTFVDPSKRNYDVDPWRILGGDYWASRTDIILSFVRDNFTFWFAILALVGVALLLFKYKTLFGKFMIGYTVAVIPYIFLISSKLAGHSYYQMPFLPLIAIASAYVFYIAGMLLKQIFKHPVLLYVPLVLLLFTIPEVQDANDRVFGTVFYGQDFIGEYLKTRLHPEERFTAFTHSQDLATCSYARHRCGFVGNVDELQQKEEVFNLRYAYVGVNKMNDLFNSDDPLWMYVRETYRIDLVGLMHINGQLSPRHVVLKKGGTFDLSDIQNKEPQLGKTYDSKRGPVPYYFIQNLDLQ